MAEKYNYPKELGAHQVNEICPEVVGFHAWNPGLVANSPSRSTMMSSHASQRLVIDGAEIPLTISGVEVEYSKYTTSDRVPFDARVFQVIARYPSGDSANSLKFNPEHLVIIVNDETGEYDVVQVPYFKSYHQYFGYRNKRSSELETLRPGSQLPEDFVLGDTPGNIGDFYTMTTNLNCMLASSDIVAEDSVLMCEDVRPKFKYRIYERRTASVGSRKFPVNQGKSGEYKGMPDIGDYIDDDGAIMYLREWADGLAPVTLSRSSTRNINYAFDEAIYGRQGQRGRVVDIRVIGNADTNCSLPPQMAAQFEKYRQAYIRFNEELLHCERKIISESTKKFGTNRPNLSNRLHGMLVTARAVCDHTRPGNDMPLQAIMNKNPLDDYYIEFVIEYELLPTIGSKVTSFSGDKGIITAFLPRHRMPVDKEGTSADIVMGPDGTVARTNYARLYLMQFGAAAVRMYKELKIITGLDETASQEEVEYLDKDVYNRALNFLLEGYACVNPDFANMIAELSFADKSLHIAECLEAGTRFVRPVDCQKPLPWAAMDLENFLPVCYDVVTHQLIEDGKTETTKDPILIGPLPVMALDKIGDDTLTVATAAHGPFGVLIKYNQADKYRMPWKDSPPRTLGESEWRAFASHTMDPEMAVDMMDRSNNPDVQLEMARMQVSSLHPGGIEDIVDRKRFDYGNTRPLAIASNVFQCYGFDLKYIPELPHA